MGRPSRFMLALLVALAAPAGAHADADAAPSLVSETFVLENGLRVVLHEDHATPDLALVLWFRVGSKDESPGRTGFAHLFEHLMFKGSGHLPDGVMDRVLEEAGGWSTAFTDGDETVYIDEAASNFLEAMLYMEVDRLTTLLDVFDQAKLDNQRDVVRNERRQSYENRPYGHASLIIDETLWPKGHGYHWPTIGSHEDLVAATTDDVKAFFRNYYVPGNATLVLAGDLEPKATRALVTRLFGAIPAQPAPKRPSYAAPAPIKKPIVKTATDDVQVPRIYLSWRGPAAYSPDQPALDLAAIVLAGGKASRLYKRLVYTEQVAQDVTAYFDARELGGELRIEVTAKPGVAPDKLVRAVEEEVARLAAKPPEPAELELAINSHEASTLADLEPLTSRALRLAGYDVKLRDVGYLGKDLERYRAVKAADVQRVTATWMPASGRVLLTISPKGAR